MKVDGLILTKLLIFYRTQCESCWVQKIHVFGKGKSAVCVTIAKCLLESLYLFNIRSVIYLEFTCSCFTFFSKISASLFTCCFSLTLLAAMAGLQFSDQKYTLSQCARRLSRDLICFGIISGSCLRLQQNTLQYCTKTGFSSLKLFNSPEQLCQ